jgi:nitrate/nitrite transporter NarK
MPSANSAPTSIAYRFGRATYQTSSESSERTALRGCVSAAREEEILGGQLEAPSKSDTAGHGGIVGLAGGLGGFLLPILFGIILDLLGIYSSCFMLLYGIVWFSLTLSYLTEVRRTDVIGSDSAAATPLGK